MSVKFIESVVEEAAIDWLKGLNYEYRFGPDIACDGSSPERTNYSEVILADRLKAALFNLNSKIPSEAIEDAFKKLILSCINRRNIS